jgi:hypothetical protein
MRTPAYRRAMHEEKRCREYFVREVFFVGTKKVMRAAVT